jgi:hypothetical protein
MSLGTRIFPKPLPANSKNSQLIFPSKSSNRLRRALDHANAAVKLLMGEAVKFFFGVSSFVSQPELRESCEANFNAAGR